MVPDVVTDSKATFKMWDEWAPIVAEKGFPLAFAVQDGMTPEMVKASNVEAEVIFVGGSTDFKWNTLTSWTDNFPRVHVGRVNGLRDLMRCHRRGVESCDGTGFFRGRRAQLGELITYLAIVAREYMTILSSIRPMKNYYLISLVIEEPGVYDSEHQRRLAAAIHPMLRCHTAR